MLRTSQEYSIFKEVFSTFTVFNYVYKYITDVSFNAKSIQMHRIAIILKELAQRTGK